MYVYFEIQTERMDILANFSPNLEALRLLVPYRNDEEDLPPGASLSTINFKKLTSLSLFGEFQLHDGAFLLSVNRRSLTYFFINTLTLIFVMLLFLFR